MSAWPITAAVCQQPHSSSPEVPFPAPCHRAEDLMGFACCTSSCRLPACTSWRHWLRPECTTQDAALPGLPSRPAHCAACNLQHVAPPSCWLAVRSGLSCSLDPDQKLKLKLSSASASQPSQSAGRGGAHMRAPGIRADHGVACTAEDSPDPASGGQAWHAAPPGECGIANPLGMLED